MSKDESIFGAPMSVPYGQPHPWVQKQIRESEKLFGRVDLSSIPIHERVPGVDYGGYEAPPVGRDPEDRTKLIWTEAPDQEIMQEYADRVLKSGQLDDMDPDAAADFINDVNDMASEGVAESFMTAQPSYYPCEENWKMLVTRLAQKFLRRGEYSSVLASGKKRSNSDTSAQELLQRKGHWTVKNLLDAFRELYATGELVYDPSELKPVSETEKDYCLSIAGTGIQGAWDEAVLYYIFFRLGNDATEAKQLMRSRGFDVLSFLAENRDLANEAQWLLWTNLNPDFEPYKPQARSIELRMQQYIGERPVTPAILNKAFEYSKLHGLEPVEG